MILATYSTYADADAVMCDTRHMDDMLHHMIVPIYSVIVTPDVPTACKRVINQLIDEFDDLDPDAIDTPADFLVTLDRDNELNTSDCHVFDVYLKEENVAKLIMRRVNV